MREHAGRHRVKEEPGAVGLTSPSMNTITTRPTTDMIPMIDEMERTDRGRKVGGVRTKNATTFHSVLVTCGTRALSESANKTTRETHAATSSREKRSETSTLALDPKAA